MEKSEQIYQSYVTYESGKKSDVIELRDEQKDAVREAKTYFEKSVDNNHFLWNAKMRFGKTFCAMELAIEMGESEVDPKGKKDSKPINRVLIVTHRPVVKDGFDKDLKKLQESLKKKGQLHRQWGFGTRSDDDNTGDFFELEEKLTKKNAPYVFFSSTQWLCYSKEVGGTIDDPLRKAILNTNWDMVVIDEAHEGILAERGSEVIAKLTKPTTKMLYMSGTPFNLLEGSKGFGEKQIYSWDYIQEQKKKNEWPTMHPKETNPYQDLPKMNIFAFDMGSLIPGKDYKKGDMFSFGELFRTYVGRPEVDDPTERKYQATKDQIGKFVHEDDVNKFLDLMYLGDEKTNYPFTKEQYQENFKHTLWIVPGVKAAKALKDLLDKHPLFGSDDFKVVNVAGNNDEAEGLDDLSRVKKAIANTPYTITLSCGKLTTGVTVPEWTAVFYMKGSADSSPAAYMQTIFRVQSPHVVNGQMKSNCYVFDFAPGRSLKVVAETAKFARKKEVKGRKGKIMTQEDEETIKEFTTYCPIWQPVVANENSELKPVDTEDIINELNKVYIEKIVKNGFDDYNIYLDDEILNLDDDIIQQTKDIVDNIPGDDSVKGKKKDGTEISDDGGLTTTTTTKKPSKKEKESAKDKWKKEVESGKTTDDFDTWFEKKQIEKEQEEKLKSTRKLIHAITKRIPLLMFGAEVDDEKIGITIGNITERIDDASWNEFMPKGATKAYFKKIRHCYNDTMFKKAGTMIRDMARNTDEMHIEDRIARIAEIFNYFKNPDSETVLTPWPVVNRHMSDTIGGYCFYDTTFKRPNMVAVKDEKGNVLLDESGKPKMTETKHPREVNNGKVTNDIFFNIDSSKGESKSKVLEINSKTGLYPLYVAYSLYKPLLELYKEKHAIDDPDNVAISEEQAIWDTIIKNNLFVICNTDMAARVTYRTLAGYREIQNVDTSTISEEHYIKGLHIVSDKLVSKAIANKEELVGEIKTMSFWNKDKEDKRNMEFNAIVGNPPYQISDKGNAASDAAAPIYQHFVGVAKALAPNYVSIIMPSKWMVGGRSELDSFREDMKNDTHIQSLFDVEDDRSIFPTAHNDGGICYFLWNLNKTEEQIDYKFYPIGGDVVQGTTLKNKYSKYVMRNNNLVRILDMLRLDKGSLSSIVSKTQPFGIRKDVFNNPENYVSAKLSDMPFDGSIKIYGVKGFKGGAKRTVGYITKAIINDKYDAMDKHKVFFTTSYSSNAKTAPEPIKGLPNEICTETFLLIGPFKSKTEMNNFYNYTQTSFFRFLLYHGHGTMQVNKEVFSYIPLLDFSKAWDDEKLYKEFGIKSADDIKLIESIKED